MEKWIQKVKNFWWYYKTPLMIAAAVIIVLIYLALQTVGVSEPDYHIGLVRASGCTGEDAARLEAFFTSLGQDENGDGEIIVQLHIFAVELADTSENAGYRSYETIAALDADLVGNVSGIFLLEDPDAFQKSTEDLLCEPILPWEDGLYLALRKDAGESYVRLFQEYLRNP